MGIFDRETQDIFKLEIDDEAKAIFLEMSRWTKFLAIMGFIFMGLFIVLGIVFAVIFARLADTNPVLGNLSPAFFMFLYIILAGIYFYPTLALIQYSRRMKLALQSSNRAEFNAAIRHLKNMFKYIGILVIVMLAFYGIAILFGLLGALRQGV